MPKTQEKSKTTKPFKNGEKTDPKTGKFLPGNGGGPGRPRGSMGITTLLRVLLKELPENGDKTYAELVAKRLILNAMSGKEKSIGMLLDRADGKVAEEWKGEIEHTGAITNVQLEGKDNKAVVGVWKDFLKSQVKKRNAKRAEAE